MPAAKIVRKIANALSLCTNALSAAIAIMETTPRLTMSAKRAAHETKFANKREKSG
jgi:hypothetical protein